MFRKATGGGVAAKLLRQKPKEVQDAMVEKAAEFLPNQPELQS